MKCTGINLNKTFHIKEKKILQSNCKKKKRRKEINNLKKRFKGIMKHQSDTEPN